MLPKWAGSPDEFLTTEGLTVKDISQQAVKIQDLSTKVSTLFQKRAQLAQQRFTQSVLAAYQEQIADLVAKPLYPADCTSRGRRTF